MRNDLAGFLMLTAGLLLLCAAGVLGWQAFQWLRLGEWPALPITYTISLWLDLPWDAWLNYPAGRWVGVHKILDNTPLAAALALVSVVVAWIGAKLE